MEGDEENVPVVQYRRGNWNMEINVKLLGEPCPCGRKHIVAVEQAVIESGAIRRLPDFLKKHGFRRPAVVCDDNTWRAAGKAVKELIGPCAEARLAPDNLHATETAVARTQSLLPAESDVLIAAGSGTVHDITRYIAHERNLPFVSVPTAASVDGFVSTVAAMTWHGFKKTFPAVSPIAVFADTDIFPNAPYRLTASGVSDLLGKYTALADWKIAHLVTDEPICDRVVSLEEKALRTVCTSLDKVRAREPEACAQLMVALLLSGLAMQMVGNSRPASGAEHHVSHLLEMEILNPHLDAYHGEKVGVGLLLASRVYHRDAELLRSGRYEIPPYAGLEKELLRQKIRSDAFYETILQENDPDPLAGIDAASLRTKVPGIVRILDEVPSEEDLSGLLTQAGAPTSLRGIGADENLREMLVRLSPYVRCRLTYMRLRKLFRFEL